MNRETDLSNDEDEQPVEDQNTSPQVDQPNDRYTNYNNRNHDGEEEEEEHQVENDLSEIEHDQNQLLSNKSNDEMNDTIHQSSMVRSRVNISSRSSIPTSSSSSNVDIVLSSDVHHVRQLLLLQKMLRKYRKKKKELSPSVGLSPIRHRNVQNILKNKYLLQSDTSQSTFEGDEKDNPLSMEKYGIVSDENIAYSKRLLQKGDIPCIRQCRASVIVYNKRNEGEKMKNSIFELSSKDTRDKDQISHEGKPKFVLYSGSVGRYSFLNDFCYFDLPEQNIFKTVSKHNEGEMGKESDMLVEIKWNRTEFEKESKTKKNSNKKLQSTSNHTKTDSSNNTVTPSQKEISEVSSPHPRGRIISDLVYDELNQRFLIFGGKASGRKRLSDIWEFDLKSKMWKVLYERTMYIKNELYKNPELDIRQVEIPENISGNSTVLREVKVESKGKLSIDAERDEEVQYEQFLVIFGGSNGFKSLSSLYEFNLKTLTWREIQKDLSKNTNQDEIIKSKEHWPSRRHSHSAIMKDENSMVIFGGHMGKNIVFNDCWVYSFESNKWKELNTVGKEKPQPRSLHSATFVPEDIKKQRNSMMFVFGGHNKYQKFNDLFSLDFKSLKWTKYNIQALDTPILPRINSSMSFDENNNMIYIVGGHTDYDHDLVSLDSYQIHIPMLKNQRLIAEAQSIATQITWFLYQHCVNHSIKAFTTNNLDSKIIGIENLFVEDDVYPWSCDTIVYIENEVNYCHSFILFQNSFFKEEIKIAREESHLKDLNIDTDKKNTNRKKKIIIRISKNNIDPSIFPLILSYMYGIDILQQENEEDKDMNSSFIKSVNNLNYLNLENIALVLKAAKYLEMDSLVHFCKVQFRHLISIDSVIECMNEAEKHRETYVYNECKMFITAHLKDICVKSNFKSLSKESIYQILLEDKGIDINNIVNEKIETPFNLQKQEEEKDKSNNQMRKVYYSSHNRIIKHLKRLRTIYLNDTYDLILKTTDDKCHKCHKAILCSQSQYFESMLSSDFIESSQDVIELEEVDSNTLIVVLNYLYGWFALEETEDEELTNFIKSLDENHQLKYTQLQQVPFDVLQDVIVFADMLCFEELRDLCIEIIS